LLVLTQTHQPSYRALVCTAEALPFVTDFSCSCSPQWQAQRAEPLCLPLLQLEEKLKTELQHTGISSVGHLPEVAIVASAIHLVELRMVEGVERFCAEL
jgi:hypothetical protein